MDSSFLTYDLMKLVVSVFNPKAYKSSFTV